MSCKYDIIDVVICFQISIFEPLETTLYRIEIDEQQL